MPKRQNKRPALITPIKDKDIGTSVWRNCRRGCGSNNAVIELKLKLEAGGIQIRYKCSGCGHRAMVTL